MGGTDVLGIILAAGESRRFGSPKQLLPFGESTLLGHVVRNVNASRLERVVVVLGREAETICERVDFGRAEVVDNRDYPSGCASSLLAGLDEAGDSDGVMLLLGDQPGVGREIIDRLLEAWRLGRSWAALVSYRGRLGHPLLFARDAFDALRSLHGDKAVWKLIEANPERVLEVPVDVELPPDIDTPEDYARVRVT